MAKIKTFKSTQLFKPNAESEYKKGSKYTVVGWIIELYLFPEDKDGYVSASSGSRDKYERAISILERLGKKPKSKSLIEWEETLSVTKATSLLNQVIKEMKVVKKKKETKEV